MDLIKPSLHHYQEILRSIIALFVIITLFYIREFSEMSNFADYLEGRRVISGVSELSISVVMGIVLAFGVDRAVLPILKKLSSKPPIELMPNGIRYHYNKSHADILFVDIEHMKTKQEPNYCIELQIKNGQKLELSGYLNMEHLEAHLQQGI